MCIIWYYLGKARTLLELLVSCSDKSPACRHPGLPLFSPDFAGSGRCLTPFFGPDPALLTQIFIQPEFSPSHPKNRWGEEDLQKYTKISSPSELVKKGTCPRLNCLHTLYVSGIIPPMQLFLSWAYLVWKVPINRIIFMYYLYSKCYHEHHLFYQFINCYVVKQTWKFWGSFSSSFSEWKDTLLLIPASWYQLSAHHHLDSKKRQKKKNPTFHPKI